MTEVTKDTETLIVPQRPKRMSNSDLPRGGSNHMARLRRELINTYNTCVVSQRHVEEFNELVTAVLKETRTFMKDVKVFNEDKAKLQAQLDAKAAKQKAAQDKLAELAADAVDPIVRVFSFTDKNKLDVWAKTKGVTLDARTALDSMKAVFIKEYKEPTHKDNK